MALRVNLLGALALAIFATWTQAKHAAAQTVLYLADAPSAEPNVEFSLDDLAAMPQVTLMTVNEFVDGPVTYRGPLVRDLIAGHPHERAETLRFTAANDYSVDIPISDFTDYDVILAMEADGERLSRRDKGPLWLMYPITENPELGEPPYIDRLIWQVVRIDAL